MAAAIFAAAHSSSLKAVGQGFDGDIQSDFVAVLEAVSYRLGRGCDMDRDPIRFVLLNPICACLTRKSYEPQWSIVSP